MKRGIWIPILLIVSIIIVMMVTSKESGNPEDKYESTWRSPGDQLAPISIIMGKNKISGCGEFHIKQRNDGSSEYLIACSRDGTNWTYYLVWLGSGEIMGPLSDKLSKPY